jgi:hypothetical protein
MKKMMLSITAVVALCSTSTAQDWLLNGNAGTNGGVNYLGTTDLHPLVFRTNAQERMRIDSTNGFVGIGTNAPKFKLSIDGNATIAHQTIGINNTPVVYLPLQNSSLQSSIAFGTGLRNLVPSTVISNQGSGNTAVGISALDSLSTGIGNTAIGWGSQRQNESGDANVSVGAHSMFMVKSGSRNIGLGFWALHTVISGWDNIGIGAFTATIGPNAATMTNAVAIGYNSKIGKSNAISLGDTTKPTLVGIGTAYPDYQLDVRAAANPARLRGLQAGSLSDYVVTATSDGVLRQIPASSIGGTVNGDQGVTTDGSNTVFLGDDCSKGGGKFKKDREINMDNLNLYFNSSEIGKLYMGIAGDCKKLDTRLEISAKGLPYINDYDVTRPSPSGLRFTDLTAKDEPIKPKYKGVLSLDDDGDVIWVESPCCDGGGGGNAWLTGGNAGTSSAANFVGTTDAQDLTFRTANLERLRITQTGRLALSNNANTYIDGGNELTLGMQNTVVGKGAFVNNSTGMANVAIGNQSMASNTSGGANVAMGNSSLKNTTTGINNTVVGNAAMEVNVTGKFNTSVGNHSLFASSGDGNTALGYLAGANLLSGSNNVFVGYNIGGAGDLSSGSNNILIGYAAQPNVSTTGSNQLNIGNWIYGNNGKIGIGSGTQNPTARLHINAADGVRFQNLPSGTGNVVVIDAAGNLYRATSTAAMPAPASEVEDLKNTVEDLKAEVAELKSMLYELKGLGSETDWKVDGAANKLFQNVPNPSDKTTRIEYILNRDCNDAYITLYDMNGKSIDRIAVKATAGKSSVQVNLEKLAAGSYSYALFVNGAKQDAKIMQIVR